VRKPGIAKRVREIFQAHPRKAFRVAEIASELGLSYEKVANAVADMFRRGEIERVGYGRYRYVGKEIIRGRKTPALRRRICKAIHAKVTFTAREIVLLSGVGRSYVHKTLRRLVAEGLVEPLGTKKGPKGFPEKLYRLARRDELYQKYVLEVGK